MLHDTESAFDEMGEDTGAENVARFIQGRSTAGSYHDLVDSDSIVPLIPYEHGAFHDGTGSNNWALSLSFACRTIDWRRMTPTKRKAMLRNGAEAFARQQAYRRSIGAPLTELRLITKAQSDAGMSGFIYHGWRDPGRRSDPGTIPPNLFPFTEFIHECAIALGIQEDDDMPYNQWPIEDRNRLLTDVREQIGLATPGIVQAFLQAPVAMADGSERTVSAILGWSDQRELDTRSGVDAAVAEAARGGDPDALAAALKDALGDQLAADVAARLRVTTT